MRRPAEPDIAGVVVAAGRSSRFGGSRPKQFLLLDGRPLLEHAVAALHEQPDVAAIVVVLPPEMIDGPEAGRVRALPGVSCVAAGGATRDASVRNGLAAAPALPYALVHDAARPMAGAPLVRRVIEATRACGAAVPVVPVPDTVKRVGPDGLVVETIDRTPLRAAQTPQGARRDWLDEALAQAARDGVSVTDEACALERAGRPVRVVDGDPANRKITSPEDLAALRGRPEGEAMGLRVGIGFDVHRFAEGRKLVLGGLAFEDETGLEGLSLIHI